MPQQMQRESARAGAFDMVGISVFTSFEGGADIRYVAEMLGHAKLETTAIYTRVSIAKLRSVHQATHPTGR
jgi:site-specific recombinase XerC